ncbi:MAG: hypothetical protein R3288_07845 [Woeseiaceae bacterium]|nr:hypothetical protein [Woeseiaceae bacterium]
MARLSVRELRLLLAGAGCVLTAALMLAFVVPKAKELVAARKVVAVLEEAAVDGSELDRHLQERTAIIEELRYRLHGDMASLPAKQVEAFIIGRLQKISWNNDVDLVSVEPTVGERIEVFQETLFHVRLNGRYRDLYRWLWEARTELGFVVIKQFELTRSDDADEDPALLARLSLASYRAVE